MDARLAGVLIAVAASLLPARRAHADGTSGGSTATPAVGGVVAVGGNAEERDRAAVSAGAMAATRQAGWQLPAKPLTKKESTSLLRCLDPGEPWNCIPGSIGSQGIHQALVVAAEKQQAEDGSPVVVLTAKLIVTQPHALAVRRRLCEHCADDRLTQASSELTEQLLQELAVRMGRTVLEVKSSPSGARIVLDGVPVGATNMTFNTYPGPHVVILEAPGYLTQTIPVDAQEGKTAAVAVTLQPSASVPPPPKIATQHEEPSRLAPIALFSAGGAALVGSGILIYLGAQSGPDQDVLHTSAKAHGIELGILGVAAIGAGAYLWWRGSTSAPTVSVTPGAAVVGWTRAF